jgi:hypothetical protein
MTFKFSRSVLLITTLSVSGMMFQACSGCKKGDDSDLLKPDSASQVGLMDKYNQTLAEGDQDKSGVIKREYVSGPEAADEPTGTEAKANLADPYEEMEPVLDDLERKLSPVIDRAWRQSGLKGYISFDLTVNPDGKVVKFNLKHSDVDKQTLATVKAISRSTKFKPHDPSAGNLFTPPMKFLSP